MFSYRFISWSKKMYNTYGWADQPDFTPTAFHNEFIANHLSLSFPVSKDLYSAKSEFQVLKIVESPHFGKILLMDNIIQSSQSDECIYHESLVHPPLLSHPHPRSVFVGGGGEGGTLREILKHKSVEKLVMCDIDKTAVEACRTHLPEWSLGAFEDPRLTLVHTDAEKYLNETENVFDVIIMDICDPVEEGPGWRLYTKEFYSSLVANKLRDTNSIFVTQSTAISVNLIKECFTVIYKTLKEVFNYVSPYRASVPSFGSVWGFIVCSQSDLHLLSKRSMEESVDRLLRERLNDNADCLKHYNGECHVHMFNLCKYEKDAIESETRVLSLDNPVFMASRNVQPEKAAERHRPTDKIGGS